MGKFRVNTSEFGRKIREAARANGAAALKAMQDKVREEAANLILKLQNQ